MAPLRYREHQRFSLVLPAVVTAPSRGVSARGSALDLGLGGGAFELDTPLRHGEPVEVLIGEGQLEPLRGQVAWVAWGESSAVRLGVRFHASAEAAVVALLDGHGDRRSVGT